MKKTLLMILTAAFLAGPAAVDEHVGDRLEDRKLKAAAVATDAEFLRRVYLDLNGRVPTPEQAAAFLDDQAADKRAKLIDTLLASPEFGNHFGRTWREWICPPELPSDMNSGRQPVEQGKRGLANDLTCRAVLGKLAPAKIAAKAGRQVVLCHYRKEKTPHKILVRSHDDTIRGNIVAMNEKTMRVATSAGAIQVALEPDAHFWSTACRLTGKRWSRKVVR